MGCSQTDLNFPSHENVWAWMIYFHLAADFPCYLKKKIESEKETKY